MSYGNPISAVMPTAGTTTGNRDQPTEWQGTNNWIDIDKAVDEENQLRVADRFLPPYPLSGLPIANRDVIDPHTSPILSVQQSDPLRLIEIGVRWALTEAQVKEEADCPTGVTLAHRAGALAALAHDLVIFQGNTSLEDPVFKNKLVDVSGDAGTGLVFSADQIVKVFPVEVDPEDPDQNKYGENTFGSVAKAFALLQKSHYGGCTFVAHTNIGADTYAALPGTLAVPAERIKGLLSNQFYVSSALPPFTGIVVANHGDTMDLVVKQAPLTKWTQTANSLSVFRLYETIGLRVKDPTAVVRLDFQKTKREVEGSRTPVSAR